MTRWPTLLALGAVLLMVAPVDAAPEKTEPTAKTVELTYKAYRRWKLQLPAERFRPVGSTLEVAGAKTPFAMRVEGDALEVDTNGDGAHDVTVEGDDGFVAFKTDGETPVRYALRLVKGSAGWAAAPGCARVGTIEGVKVQVIDQDGNGTYGDVGTDALIVGGSKAAAYLSKVINVGGSLYTIDIAKDGSKLTYTPYAGKAGMLDLISEHESKTKVLTVLVRSQDGTHCFDLARAPEGLRVPAGTYELVGGTLGLGAARVAFTTGRAKPIAVQADETTRLSWGGPLRAEYRYALTTSEVAFQPDQIWYYGKAGEQYTTWAPFGKSPEFVLVSTKTNDEIAKAIFTGC
ncbi:MAG: hypothetical protein QNJ98_18560 [Planctomycetota bacterium]|nr:hypothetical protein [Planctomycetota bacterium]